MPPIPDALYRATKGNPLFVVESVRAGAQSGRDVHRRAAEYTP